VTQVQVLKDLFRNDWRIIELIKAYPLGSIERTKDIFLKERESSLSSEILLKLLEDSNLKLMKAWLGVEIAF
jgi:hypothetical protein